ncbi:MAG: ribulose-phosphate 3-epimerase [Candidatus Korarchaeota archaeon]|nr:ribulose-phosphate 3-epimerase [Candidatus Korarchaeota archaeon]
MTVSLSASILSADLSNLREEVARAQEGGVDSIHVDVMDGHFVPNLSFGLPVVRALRRTTDLPIEAHLMIELPERYADRFVEAGADVIYFHVESASRPISLSTSLRSAGVKVGVALNPGTPLSTIEELLDSVDRILVMTVEPGFGGQRFIEGTLRKISKLRRLIENGGLNLEIAVDGGINCSTVSKVVEAGATVLIAGSAIFGKGDPAEAARLLRRCAEDRA